MEDSKCGYIFTDEEATKIFDVVRGKSWDAVRALKHAKELGKKFGIIIISWVDVHNYED